MAYVPLTKIPQQFFDNLGNPLVGGTIYAYLAGTSTPTNMFSDNAGTVAGTSVVLDSRGEPTTFKLIWIDSTKNYKFTLKDSTGTTIWTKDDISGDDTADASMVTYVPAGSGAVTTTVQTKLRETVSVNDFGATGDGVTNDTAAIQKAITAINNAGGGTLIFDGQYNLGTTPAGPLATKFDITTNNVTLIFYKGTKFFVTSDASITQIFQLNGVSNINTVGVLSVESASSTPYATTGSYGARALVILNNANADCGNIFVDSINITRGAQGLLVGSASNYRIKNINVENIVTTDVTYGANFANNGDNVSIKNLTTTNAYRSYFAYGCKNHKANVTAINHYAGGTPINLSRYSAAEGGSSTNTESFSLSLEVIDPGINVTCATLRHLGDDGVTQKIQGINIKMSANVFNTGLTMANMLNYTGSGGSITTTTFNAVITNIQLEVNAPDNIAGVYLGGGCNWAVTPIVTTSGSRPVTVAEAYVSAAYVDFRSHGGLASRTSDKTAATAYCFTGQNSNLIWTVGAGTPEGAVSARVGSLYTRTDGGAGTTLYVKESGTGNTGWVAK